MYNSTNLGNENKKLSLETKTLEERAIEGFCDGTLTPLQAREMLGLTRYGFEGFLKERNIYDHAYDVADLQEDLRTLSKNRQ